MVRLVASYPLAKFGVPGFPRERVRVRVRVRVLVRGQYWPHLVSIRPHSRFAGRIWATFTQTPRPLLGFGHRRQLICRPQFIILIMPLVFLGHNQTWATSSAGVGVAWLWAAFSAGVGVAGLWAAISGGIGVAGLWAAISAEVEVVDFMPDF